MSKDLKNCRIDDNGNITMKMVKMGMDIDETRNHRIRGIVPTEDGDYVFVEIMSAYKPNRKYFTTPEQRKKYDETYTVPQYIHIDFCFRVDVPEDHFRNYSSKYSKYSKESYTHYDYTNENIIKLLQKLNPKITSVELINDYYLTDFCNENRFYELYDNRLDHSFKPIEISWMGKYDMNLKVKYSCYNYNHEVYYEEEKKIQLNNYDLEDLYNKYGKDNMEKLINDYNEEVNKSYKNKNDEIVL